MNFYTHEELNEIGFSSVGQNVLISRNAKFYNPQNIKLASNIRIDDFCVLSAGSSIEIEDYVHIAVGCTLIGNGEIHLSKFAGLSSNVAIYSSSDDFSGNYLTGPTITIDFRNVNSAKVFIGRHVIIGSGSIILPNAIIEDGVAVGALTVIRKRCKAFGIYLGNPARLIKERKKDLLQLEEKFLAEHMCKHTT